MNDTGGLLVVGAERAADGATLARTTTSGARSRARICPMTAASTSPAGTLRIGHASWPNFRAVVVR
jgi:hypothetical protein